MSKPIENITFTTLDDKSVSVEALFDSGSCYTIIRKDVLPAGTQILYYKDPIILGTANIGGALKIKGLTGLILKIGDKMIDTSARVAEDLNGELIIGAKTMQAWDISIQTKNGKTEIIVGLDMRDPNITKVL